MRVPRLLTDPAGDLTKLREAESKGMARRSRARASSSLFGVDGLSVADEKQRLEEAAHRPRALSRRTLDSNALRLDRREISMLKDRRQEAAESRLVAGPPSAICRASSLL